MKKMLMLIMLVSIVVVNLGLTQASAQLADGTHSIKYQVNKPDSNSASIANDYFVKPANVTVKNGTATVQITLKTVHGLQNFNRPVAQLLSVKIKQQTHVLYNSRLKIYPNQ